MSLGKSIHARKADSMKISRLFLFSQFYACQTFVNNWKAFETNITDYVGIIKIPYLTLPYRTKLRYAILSAFY